MLKDYRARILNHGFGEHCLLFLLDFWTFEAKGSRAWKSLECVFIHDALSDGIPKNIFWDCSSVVLCAQGYHWANSYFILLDTQFPDSYASGPWCTNSLGELLFGLWGEVEDSFLCWACSQRLWISITTLERDLTGPICQKKGIEYPDRMPAKVSCMMPLPSWNSRMGKEGLFPPSTMNLQDSQWLGWFSKKLYDASSVHHLILISIILPSII